jgi:hypothetical protein
LTALFTLSRILDSKDDLYAEAPNPQREALGLALPIAADILQERLLAKSALSLLRADEGSSR